MKRRNWELVVTKLALLVSIPGVMAALAVHGGAVVDEPVFPGLLNELFMVAGSTLWILVLGPRYFRARTMVILGVAAVLLYAGFWADLFSDLLSAQASFDLVEDLTTPIGMATATFGLMLWVLDHKAALAGLAAQEAEFRRLSLVDSLTGLNNSKRFFELIDTERRRALRYGRQLSMAFLDIDNFKTFNDEYGHLEGDRLLREIGRLMSEECREDDTAFRYGGEEFTVLFPETGSEQAAVVAERIRTRVESTTLRLRGGGVAGRTVSIGVASLHDDDGSVKDLVDRADKAMYAAKLGGKNKVVIDGQGGS